jgi:hypothetical protein
MAGAEQVEPLVHGAQGGLDTLDVPRDIDLASTVTLDPGRQITENLAHRSIRHGSASFSTIS